ncbi:MAG: SRPBCC family protein [Actinomycetota bacterium]
MAHAEHSVIVNRPIAEVFAFLADGTNNPSWRPDVTSIRHVFGSGVGAQFAQTMNGPGGRSIPGDYRITRYDGPTRLDFEVTDGRARPTGSFVLRETVPGSTEVTFTLDLKPRGLMVLMTPMINKQVRVEVANIDKLAGALGA